MQGSIRLVLGFVFLSVVSVACAAEKDVIVVLDNSRTMQRIDPAGLAQSAVGRFLHELNGNARAALILFAETPAVVLPLSKLTNGSRERFLHTLQNLTRRAKDPDIALAVQRAFHELARGGREKAEKSILLMIGALSDPGDVEAVQFRLRAMGYEVGPVDGVIGPRTRGAIRKFQRDHGLVVDGQLNGLLAHLDEAHGERRSAELSAQAARAGIEISAVALGGDSPLGRQLAEKTSGKYFQVPEVQALPQVIERLKGVFVRAPEAVRPTPPAILPSPERGEPVPKPPPTASLAEEQQKPMPTAVWLWVGFITFILALLSLDLGVFHRRSHVIPVKEALAWSSVWVGFALLFNVFIYFIYEHHWFSLDTGRDVPDGWAAAALFFTGYVVELSLSVDNMFVIAMIFSYFAVPSQYQHRVLFWGILGALVMRAVMIVTGVALIQRFHWILYLFGAFLIVTAAKMLLSRHEPVPGDNLLVRWIRRAFPITEDFVGERFTVRRDGKLLLTPLMLALITVEGSDLMFAVDSIPAIFAITEDPFIIFSSNVFAILGLRSLYFALAGIMDKFHYLKRSLALLLGVIGVKMLLKDVLHAVPNMTYYMLGIIALILTAGVVASLIRTKRMKKRGVTSLSPIRRSPLRTSPVSFQALRASTGRESRP